MDISKVDLNLLVVFDALLRWNSVSRAADALGMSQPAMSFALNKLRRLFDDPLFIRVARGVRPTPRAEQLALPLRRVLNQITNEVLQPQRFDPAATRRTFTINMSDVGELVFLPRIRAYMQAAAPGAAIRTVSTPAPLLEEALQSGEVDLAVGYFPEIKGAAMYQQRLFSHTFVCVVWNDHPAIRGRLTMQQFLNGQHVVVRQEGKNHPDLVQQAVAAHGLSLRVAIDVPHFLALPLLIAGSELIATVPYAVGLSFAEMADLKLLRPPLDIGRADVKQFWHARFHHDRASMWLRTMITDLFLGSPKAVRGAEGSGSLP